MNLRITYRQSGGYAGLFRGCTIDAAALKAAEAKALGRLVQAAALAQMKSAKTEGIPDLLVHDLSIQTDAGTRELSFDDLTLPEALRPLVEFLDPRCKPMAPPPWV